jgi:shikimate kinase
MSPREPHPAKVDPDGCISLIGMAAAGKTTIGRELATLLGWAHVDSDCIIESLYGTQLQRITERLGKEEFLDVEEAAITGLDVKRVVISTGGSVVYRQRAVDYLASLGPLIHLDVPLPVILERIARKPDRGLAIAPGQSIAGLYAERQELYLKAARKSFPGGESPAGHFAATIAGWLWSAD